MVTAREKEKEKGPRDRDAARSERRSNGLDLSLLFQYYKVSYSCRNTKGGRKKKTKKKKKKKKPGSPESPNP